MFPLRSVFLYVSAMILLACLAWSISPEARAAKTLQDNQAMNFTLEGKINSIDHNKLTVHTEENIIFHVSYNDKTEFKSDDGSAASSKDLRVGLKIHVDGDLTESGEIVAQKIVLEKATK